ncbi:MAG: hypothetical protein R3284_07300, partial [Rubricoccaceae bacterium]|nr:hypothetical protein [Rubricoccaceae bacterium]
FSDTRWEEAGQIGWADITWLDTDPGAEIVDLRLTPASADTLSRAGNVPKGILLEYDGDTYYRLKLGAQYKAVVELISARTGLVIPDNACS